MKWQPIIENKTTRTYILHLLSKITENINENYRAPGAGLLGGAAGISLFWSYLYSLNKKSIYLQKSYDFINHSLESILTIQANYSFSFGTSGVLWAFTHLVNSNFIEADFSEIIGDDILINSIHDSQRDLRMYGNYDYLHGALSPILYLLEIRESELVKSSLGTLVNELYRVKQHEKNEISWFDGLFLMKDKETRTNLGLAHGLPSIIVILSRLVGNGIESDKVMELLDGAINYILSKMRSMDETCLFPSQIPYPSPIKTRVAWCYGDLGIGIALYRAAIAMNNKSLQNKSFEILIHTAKRRNTSKDEAGIHDTCLCHGTAGNAHIFNRLFQETKIEEFRAASVYWFYQTLQFYEREKHFKYYGAKEDGISRFWVDEYGILEGLSGIGLAFISAISDIEPKWDRFLLLN